VTSSWSFILQLITGYSVRETAWGYFQSH